MPRFYFDKVVNGDTTYDEVGFEVASLEEARHEAVRTATEIARDLAHQGQVPEILVKVRVGGVEPVAIACLSMRVG